MGPEDQAIRSEERRQVWRALEQLNPDHRAAIVARYFLELKNIEVSDYLDRTLGSIKWSLHADTQRLRTIFYAQTNVGRASSEKVEERD